MKKINLEEILKEFNMITDLEINLKKFKTITNIHIKPGKYNIIWTYQLRKISNICKNHNLIWYIDFDFNQIVVNV